ncbi:unnamed protein product [Mytilus coruscus]|uniref:Novel STAND NTPase 3 domain-containing protein n=1 Tax=Mytilus coruscus TaxID=42192 RepID=A0A6J8EQX1_MYTCO|nr:unnamed protein product [Mytilus coruscus]
MLSCIALDLHDQPIKDWRRDDEKFIETEAAKQVETQLGKSNCVLVVGPSGIGKSSIVRHLALKLCDNNQYHIIPVIDHDDIHQFYNQKRKQLFVIDDLWGKKSININQYNYAINVKFLFAVDIDLYKDSTFNSLQSYVCDISNWPLNHQDKIEMNKNYISPESQTKLAQKLDNLLKSDEVYFPLLCKIAEEKTAEQIIMLFSNLDDFIKQEFLALKDTNNLYFCIITLCALLNNRFKEEILSDKYDSNVETEAFANICKEFNLGKHQESAKYKIKEHLENLEGTYLTKTANYYRFIHSKVYHIAVLVCGQACVQSFTKFVRSSCIAERFCFASVITENTGEFILIDKSEDKNYFDRLILDLEQGITYSTFHNSQLKYPSYREKFISYFRNRRPKVIEILNTCKRNSDTQSTQLNNNEYEDYIDFKQNHFSSHKVRKPLIESAWEGFR